jgi:hypothetical protein
VYSPSYSQGAVGGWERDFLTPVIHSLPGGFNFFNGIWFDFVDYNLISVADQADLFGQPKNYAVVQRDYSLRDGAADPWALKFNYQFARSGQGSDLDLRGLQLEDGTNISKQTALSAGISYYHRAGHFKEHPNLLNPFWRAGLARIDIDHDARDEGGDVEDTLNHVGVPWATEAWSTLRSAGYRGFR